MGWEGPRRASLIILWSARLFFLEDEPVTNHSRPSKTKSDRRTGFIGAIGSKSSSGRGLSAVKPSTRPCSARSPRAPSSRRWCNTGSARTYSLLRQHDTKTGKISLSRKEFISRLFLVAFCIPLALLLPAVSYMKNAARETVTDPGELDILNRAAVILVGSQVIFWCCGPVLELFRAWKDADR